MLKISQIEPKNGSIALRLEGRMVGPWVEEVRDASESLLAVHRILTLNLAQLEFVDRRGARLLSELKSRGVVIEGSSIFIREQLRSPNSRGD